MTEARFQPEHVIRLLSQHNVRFVLIGGVAATLHGSPLVTFDVDVAYERTKENLTRLADALAEVHARLRGVEEDLPFKPDAQTLEAGTSFTFITDLGSLDCLGWAAGAESFAELEAHAVAMQLGSERVLVASLDDLIAMKRAAGRPKDRVAVMELEAIKEMRRTDF